MSSPIVDPVTLGIYLNAGIEPDDARATLILSSAQSLCEAVVNPLPSGAEAVILDVAARAWSNPTNAQQQTTGPFSASYGPVAGGLWLTEQNRRTLLNLAGRGGAFTVDTTPATAGQNLPWWDYGTPYLSDWDAPA